MLKCYVLAFHKISYYDVEDRSDLKPYQNTGLIFCPS